MWVDDTNVVAGFNIGPVTTTLHYLLHTLLRLHLILFLDLISLWKPKYSLDLTWILFTNTRRHYVIVFPELTAPK